MGRGRVGCYIRAWGSRVCDFSDGIAAAVFGVKSDGNRDSMKRQLRILHLEDDPDFSALVRALLERETIQADLCVVSTRTDFEKALGGGNFDIILADYLLPEYNGIEALRCARVKCP